MKRLVLASALLAAVATAADAKTVKPVATDLPAGTYTTDPSHTTLLFRVDHLGFSHFTGRFTSIDTKLEGDPKHPEKAHLEVTVDPNSLALDNPPAGFLDQLKGVDWFDTAKYPKMTFVSKKIELTAPNKARILGDFTFRGVTKPLTLLATFNGGYAGHPMDPHARIGFSAHGVLKRSDYGLSYGIPAPGTTMGVGDEVEIIVETELSGPPLAGAAPAK
jgi:polyisoprenoid-binding protein YceI